MPSSLTPESCAPLGVAFVAATLALGICLGVKFDKTYRDGVGLNLSAITKTLPDNVLPEDIRHECLKGIDEAESPSSGDWFAIWGGKEMS